MKFTTKDFLSKCDQIRSFLRTHLLNKFAVTFTEQILNGKLQFLCSEKIRIRKFSDPHFSAFEMNSEIHRVNAR